MFWVAENEFNSHRFAPENLAAGNASARCSYSSSIGRQKEVNGRFYSRSIEDGTHQVFNLNVNVAKFYYFPIRNSVEVNRTGL